ncbi:hypothetical protein SDC9_166536 [bioreactor metagenome]|uniref:Uncharacterized protein n=1 Tax=bioreactor metagenome TaxID=1076179 RepID=A0A645FZV3_9ZZZZ
MARTVTVDVRRRLFDRADRLHREDEVEIFGLPVLFGRRFRVGAELPEFVVAAQLHAAFPHGRDERRNELRRRLPVDQQRFERVAGARPLAFGVADDRHRLFDVASGIDIEVTDAFIMFQHRHGRFGADQPDQFLSAARNDQIEAAVHLEQHRNRRAVGPRHKLDGSVRQAAFDRRLVEQFRQKQVRAERLAAAAQNHRVARLEADSGGVHRDVRA